MTWWIIKIILSLKCNSIGSVLMEHLGQESHDNFCVENNWYWLCLLPNDTTLSNVLKLWRPSGYSQTLIICQIMLADLQRHLQCSCEEINDSSISFDGKRKKKHQKTHCNKHSKSIQWIENGLWFDKIPSPLPILLKGILSIHWNVVFAFQSGEQ